MAEQLEKFFDMVSTLATFSSVITPFYSPLSNSSNQSFERKELLHCKYNCENGGPISGIQWKIRRKAIEHRRVLFSRLTNGYAEDISFRQMRPASKTVNKANTALIFKDCV